MEHADPQKLDSERMDRLEKHMTNIKTNVEQLTDNSNRISHALIGNEFTGGLGLIHKVKKIDEDLESLKDEMAVIKDNMSLIKWFGSGIGGLVMAIIIWLLDKNFNR